MNNCSFIGRLGHDVSLRYSPDGNAVGRFSVALDNGKDRDGNRKAPTWIECVCFGRTAEAIERFFHKGNRIGIVARAHNNDYIDKDGVSRKKIDFIVDHFDFTDEQEQPKREEPSGGYRQLNDDEVPWQRGTT